MIDQKFNIDLIKPSSTDKFNLCEQKNHIHEDHQRNKESPLFIRNFILKYKEEEEEEDQRINELVARFESFKA